MDTTHPRSSFPLVSVSELPGEARETLALIRKGGPYPYSKDGSIFSNRERILPKEPRGFYHEFTVKTPHARDRGARRVICGGALAKQQPQVLETCYYTDDHYASFKKIKE
ncbi:MAG: ribonuclease domain-containing protein [Betaproteobacteria bacterium]